MADTPNLAEAIKARGPFAVWDLMGDDDRRAAAAALWTSDDRDSRAALELAVAKELKFRPQSVRRLGADRVVPRLVRMASTLPDAVLFQFLFHLHLAERRTLLVEFLDAVGLPHDNGILDLKDETITPDPDHLRTAAGALLAQHGKPALVYLATLKVADAEFWSGLDELLAQYGADGEKLE